MLRLDGQHQAARPHLPCAGHAEIAFVGAQIHEGVARFQKMFHHPEHFRLVAAFFQECEPEITGGIEPEHAFGCGCLDAADAKQLLDESGKHRGPDAHDQSSKADVAVHGVEMARAVRRVRRKISFSMSQL